MSSLQINSAGYQNFAAQNIDDVRTAIMAAVPLKPLFMGSRWGMPDRLNPSLKATPDDLQKAMDIANTEGKTEIAKAIGNLKTALVNKNPRLDQNSDGTLTFYLRGSHPWLPMGTNEVDELDSFARLAGSQENGLNQKLDITDFGFNLQTIGSYPTIPSIPTLPTSPALPYCPPAIPTNTTGQPDMNIINNFFGLLAGLRGSQPYGNTGFNGNCMPQPTYNYGGFGGGYGAQPYGSNGYNLNIINNFGLSGQQNGLGSLLQRLFNRRYF